MAAQSNREIMGLDGIEVKICLKVCIIPYCGIL